MVVGGAWGGWNPEISMLSSCAMQHINQSCLGRILAVFLLALHAISSN